MKLSSLNAIITVLYAKSFKYVSGKNNAKPPSHGRGRRFESRIAHQDISRVYDIFRKPFFFSLVLYLF
jgi:hypothetical protein